MARDDFNRRGIDEVKDESSSASVFGIGIPIFIVAVAALLYFFYPFTDEKFSQAETTPPATTQQAPKTNPDQINVQPEGEKKAPPAATNQQDHERDPRTDSHNSN
ncbi:MAG: hypothetical protein KF807_13745 [Xanthobacteraceae bacterium]|nr:hypothetical protein [Xanthobacteraceae bacterium]